jgi:hypothetical protein
MVVLTRTILWVTLFATFLTVRTASQVSMAVDARGPAVDEDRLWVEEQVLGGTKPIYGEDDRRDWGQIDDPRVKKVVQASVALFSSSELKLLPDGRFQSNARRLGTTWSLCKEENFSQQITAAFCSGVLVAENIVVTAGHCISEVGKKPGSFPLSAIHFVFGFDADHHEDAGRSQFDSQQVYAGIKIVGAGVQSFGRSIEDWAAILLDRPVPLTIAQPITLGRTSVENGSRVYVVGYPIGLPVKYASGAEVRSNDGAVALLVGIRCGAISSDMKLSSQAARSIG